jgi:hypothetical protein
MPLLRNWLSVISAVDAISDPTLIWLLPPKMMPLD